MGGGGSMIAVQGVKEGNAPSNLPVSITITEQYDRNYIHDETSSELHCNANTGEVRHFVEKTGVRNRWEGDNTFPSVLSLFKAKVFPLNAWERLVSSSSILTPKPTRPSIHSYD